MEKLSEVEKRLASWINVGFEHKPGSGLYRHPEFVFRKLGGWPGWNAFLGITADHPAYAENEACDLLDEMAWQLYIDRLSGKVG